MAVSVSIPFKREGLSEPHTIYYLILLSSAFQFPSNGKVFPNSRRKSQLRRLLRFQFPSNGKVFPNNDSSRMWWSYTGLTSFNSLQTGRSFRTTIVILLWLAAGKGFNSLQTGRSFRTNEVCVWKRRASRSFNSLQTGRSFRTEIEYLENKLARLVSIPFKREGLSELTPLRTQSQ